MDEKMEKILTVVVPTYNAEKYLRDNLESFKIPELMEDLEILIVNDGSTDHSLEIAEEYIRQYPDTYRVITKENGGHGSGINCGIANARGTYFKVVDADDWVGEKAFCDLVRTLKTSNADVVYSGFLWTYDNGETDKTKFQTKAEITIPFEGVEYQKTYSFDSIADKLYMKMHNMTIKTEILRENQIHIDEHCYYVDTEYITYPIPYVKTICFVDGFVYYYRLGRAGQSVGLEKMQKNEENYNKVLESLLKFYRQLGNQVPCTEIKKQYIARLIARVIAGKFKIMLSFSPSAKKKQQIKQYDQNLKTQYRDIYDSNINKAVSLLRKTQYHTYYLVNLMVRSMCR